MREFLSLEKLWPLPQVRTPAIIESCSPRTVPVKAALRGQGSTLN
jgi:hypothetical protein